MPRSPATSTRRGAVLVALAFLLVVFGLHCAADVAPLAPTDVTLLIGVGDGCASKVRAISLEVKTGDRVDLTENITITSPAMLPVLREISIPPAEGALHRASAIFEVAVDETKNAFSPVSIEFPSGTTGKLSLILACVCLGVDCPAGHVCAEEPPGSGQTECNPQAVCGDGACLLDETCSTCPEDCPCTCGDEQCTGAETCATCPADCGACCGNGTCGSGETCSTCPADCGVCCGNGVCGSTETCTSCPKDCGVCCGNGTCGSGETCANCPMDCGMCCGNGACDNGETCSTCAMDCGACCGNGVCGVGETCANCELDCGKCCGNLLCDNGETCETCPIDCGICPP